MWPPWQQFRLLLWKDYLIRKRKWITLAGVVWATAIMFCLYIVRANVNNVDNPTCQFPARALPSAGMLPFLQSFICTVNNTCNTLDKFDEIPTFENSTLTKLQRKFSPILYNDTVLDVAAIAPDAIKLLSKLADIVDEPTFVEFSKIGLRVDALFNDPKRVRRYLSSHLDINDDVARSVMTSQLNFQGIFKGIDRCSASSISATLQVQNNDHLLIIVDKLCSLTNEDIQNILIGLLGEINFNKYIKMLGHMYYKLNGDNRVTELADTVTAVQRMTRLQSFVPEELANIMYGDADFSYLPLNLIQKLLDLFKPTFADAESYKSIREVADTAIIGFQYLGKILARQANDTIEEVTGLVGGVVENKGGLKSVGQALNNAIEVFKENMANDSSVDVFSILSQITNFIYKYLPDDMKHDVLFYSTLLTKLIEGANKVVSINMNIEEMTYNVSLRHPEAIKILVELPGAVIAKGFEALADAERTQIATAKINNPGQTFCDVNKLQGFLKISQNEANSLKSQLCTDAWKNYITDLVQSFGIYEVRNIINNMASLFIQETLRKDISDQLYTLDFDFQVLKNFTQTISRMKAENRPKMDWNKLFNVSENSEFMKTIHNKAYLGKQMLITVHGALAREVVKQNPILSIKIAPTLIDTTTLVIAINKQLNTTDKDVVTRMKNMYPEVLKTVLGTALDESKTYKSLSTHSLDILCNGVENASLYLQLPEDANKEAIITTLCDVTTAIEDGLKPNSAFGKAIQTISSTSHDGLDFRPVPWTALITGLKNLYVTLSTDYPYLFQYADYGMDADTRKNVEQMFVEAKDFWFGKDLGRSVHLSVKLGFRLLDMIDRDLFNVTDDFWLKMKYSFDTISGPLIVLDDVTKVVTALYRNEDVESDLPKGTVAALTEIIPNIPQLIVDAADMIISDATDIDPIISMLNTAPYWPCSETSLSELLPLSPRSMSAVQGLETLLCLDRSLQEEWAEYLNQRNVTYFDIKKYNTTTFSPHVFLRFSSVFDSLIEDCSLLIDVVQDMTDDTHHGDNLTWSNAGRHFIAVFNNTERDDALRKFFTKLDKVVTSVNTTMVPDNQSLNVIWVNYIKCSSGFIDKECKIVSRAGWKHSLQFVSVMVENVAMDLLTYFQETNEANSTLLQLLGFTRGTPLYEIYDKLPDFIGVLLNSYWDYGFMSQVRRASLSQFWDCEAVVEALVQPIDSSIDEATIHRIQPYICPSFLYWLSLPRGDNVLIDLVSKPQYFLYTMAVQNLTSNFTNAYNKIIELADFVADIAKNNKTKLDENDIKLSSLERKLKNFVDTMVNYKINDTDLSYRFFNEINKKQFASVIYLTRIVNIVDKLRTAIDNLTISDLTDSVEEDYNKKLKTDLTAVQNIFRRRPDETIAIHYDLITNMIWEINDNFNLTNAIDTMCNNLRNEDTNKDILVNNQRVKTQICAKEYKLIYGAIEKEITDDYGKAKDSLLNLVRILQNDDNLDSVRDINQFLGQRKKLIASIRTSLKYSYELSIPVYLQYLQSNLQHYDVILAFLAGDDWWRELRGLYHGPYANKFFDAVERSFEITEDVLSNLDKIHIVRILRDIDVNNTNAFCEPNIVLSDYIPDSTGVLSDLKRQLCEEDRMELFKELPPLLFASQGYDIRLKLPRVANHTAVNTDLSETESRLSLIRSGPRAPQRPSWITNDKMETLKKVTLRLLSKETLTRVAFGVLSNLVDAGTLFLNNTQCTLCSQFTSWFKQLNLQVFKKQEYDALLCRLPEMSLHDVYYTLRNDFHWDMAIRELASTRNYTKYELNKSMNEFLELVKLHLLEDLLATSPKLSECLAHNVSRNAFGNATLFVHVLSHTARLLRAEVPHIHEVEGVKDLPYLKQLYSDVAHNLNVEEAYKIYLKNGNTLDKELMEIVENGDLVADILGGHINLRLILEPNLEQDLKVMLRKNNWEDVCKKLNCNQIIELISKNVNKTLIEKDLVKLQAQEFWRFTFVSDILEHLEELFSHVARLLGVASKLDVQGIVEGRLAAMVDFAMQVLMDDTMNGVLFSLQGLTEELHPLLQGTDLEFDLKAIGAGLKVIFQFKNYLLENEDLRVQAAKLFPEPENMESELHRLGINNTNFWSVAAPRIRAGYIDWKPVFSTKQGDYHIANFVCQHDYLSRVIQPANLDVVTADDVYSAIVEQFCGLDDDKAKEMVAVLAGGMDYKGLLDKIKDTLLAQLYAASNLTQSQGETVLNRFPRMVALLPIIQENVGDLAEAVANEPLIKDLGRSNSFGELLGSSNFRSQVGHMLCGTPIGTDGNRFYKNIAASQDFSNQPDQAQLDALPTNYCRGLYKEILNIEGGKILWSFIKPLIMGKILYTPATPTVERIIQTANSSFAHMIRLTSLIHSFADAFPSVQRLSDHRTGVEALRNVMTSPALSGLREMLVGDVALPNVDVDVDGLFSEFGDTQGMGSLLKKGSDILHCINLNRFQAVPDENQLAHEAVKLSTVNEFSAGIVFLNTQHSGDTLTNVEYKIRTDIENAPTTTRNRNYLWIPGPESSFIENMRYFRGFVQIQDLVDRAIVDIARSSRSKRDTSIHDEESKWAVYTQQEPYPCYKRDFFQTSLYESQALIVAFFFSLLFTVSSAVRFVVADKESGNTMLMSVMGVNLSCHTLAWFCASLLELVVTCACVGGVLTLGGILPRTAPSLVFALLFVFALAVLAFCYMMSKLFSSASFAAVCSSIAYLITFMPFVMILSLEAVLTSTLKIFVCLSMSSAICYSFLYITRYEAMGVGAQWHHLWAAPEGEDWSIAAGALMTLADACIYVAIGLLLDRYFGPKTLQSNTTHCTATGEKAGVSIVNISKSYGRGRRAKLVLDNVSIELHKGQITALLGHNGAGKTTLTNILTGMLKPSKGHIIIRSDNEDATRVGVCPQKNVLFDYMTPTEHVALYAQLKSGRPLADMQDEVDSILRVLSLGPVSGEPAARLSGGTRRRLCVALAFVARPALVSLDEPTAGVDPAARRDIWSMIVKLRKDRTILLTTHHLDEAELLSDQIVIMHKGQIHTIGSPIEIKRSLGNGYKLTVMFPDKRGQDSEFWNEDDGSIAERTKLLLTVVRDCVKNASLVDANGLEVEIGLPFFDANGLNNNFQQVCSCLEARQAEIGYRSYSMDCSSLEQVFFNVCQQAEVTTQHIHYDPDIPSKSASSSSIKSDETPLVPAEGPLKGSPWAQFGALLHARYIHYTRNRWLLFLLIILPSLFVATAMGFSMIRPPADNEISLRLVPHIYDDTTQYLVPHPSIYSENVDPSFAERVMNNLQFNKKTRSWTDKDTPTCKCSETRQDCDLHGYDDKDRPELMLLPNVTALNEWIVASHDMYIEKRYGGFTSSIKNNMTTLVSWYNNKGHHAMPAYINALYTAVLRVVSGNHRANITVYSHPLKISKEQISKDTVYQYIADAGISGLVLIAYALVSGAAAVYVVSARVSQEKRLQLLCGVRPAMYWAAAMTADMAIVLINMVITVIIFEAFGFPVFVARNNLPAICILIILYGYACGSFVHVSEKLFSEASLANMLLFCGNAFIGLAGIAMLLVLDIISESEATDNARWVLHKVLMLCPQFVLGDGLLEIAKNTVQALVLSRFGMDTYQDPLSTDLIAYHYLALVLVGTVLLILNLAIEYDCFEVIIARFRPVYIEERSDGEMEDLEVAAERKRVQVGIMHAAERPVRLPTIGNINAGFVDTEVKNNSIKRIVSPASDVAQCVDLSKAYPALAGTRVAVRSLTLGIPPGQCTALLGQNGAGKSTTFSMLTGEVRPTAGRIYLNDRLVNSRSLCRGLISYCPQSDAIDPLMTVRETLVLYCRLRGITEQDEVIRRTLDMFALTKYADTRACALSGGNKRKLCSAIAFMGRTPLVLLDEPTSGMDPSSRACVSRGVRVSRAGVRGVLLSTHALDDARRLAARVALLRNGKLCALASLDDCLKRFGGGYVVSCRVCRGSPRALWRRIHALAPHAQLRVMHHAILHFLMPIHATVNDKEVTSQLSDIFRLMSELQASCDIEDYTVNQSSLDQMFLSFTEKGDEDLDPVDLEPLPSPQALRKNSAELSSITTL